MAKLTVSGLEDFASMIRALGDQGESVMKAAVFAGADKMVEAVKESIRELPEEEGYMSPGEKRNTVTRDEKEALLSHIGIAKMDYTGGKVTTAIGFNGYTDHRTKKYPSGVPVPLIARSIESGSSVRRKIPFLRQAANRARDQVQKAMVDAAEKTMQELKKE